MWHETERNSAAHDASRTHDPRARRLDVQHLHDYYLAQRFRHVRTVVDHSTPSAVLFARPVPAAPTGRTSESPARQRIEPRG
jgi:hypothetical protein